LVGVGAERAAAVGDDLAVRGSFRESLFEFGERDGAGTVDVSSVKFFAGSDVDEYDFAGAHAGDEFLAADRVDLGSEVVAGGAFDLG
jgi:hypothetical protein